MTSQATVISSSSLHNVIARDKKNNGATFTINSIATGKDYTYSIARKKWNDKWYTHIRVESGYLNFKYLGSYFNGKLYHKGSVVESPSAKAIAYVLNLVEKKAFDWLDQRMEVMHTGNCLCCGRELTDANSIKLGLGPICAQHQ